MHLTHLGHSCLLIDAADTRVLIDPGVYAAGLSEVRDLDAIVITHQHDDHLDRTRIADLVAANPRAELFADPESSEMLRSLGLQVTPSEHDVVRSVGGLTITGVGTHHAYNHSGVPVVTNVGVVVCGPNEPSLYHPGDSYDGHPGEVDILALPLNAPWAAVRDTIGFVRRIAPGYLVPIHDALVSPTGRAMYLGHVVTHGGDLQLLDLAASAVPTLVE